MYNDLFTIGNITIHGYGLMIGIGILAAFGMAMYRAPRKGLNKDYLFDMGFVGVLGGILGAKLLYIIIDLPAIIENPSMLLNVSEGFVIYGGIIGGILTPYIYNRIKKKGVFIEYLDLAIPSIPLAQGFGRIGCFLAGCCYGRETESVFGIVFPQGSFAPAGVKLLPTQLMSSAGDFLIAFILILVARKNKRNGRIAALYMIMYAIGRFFIEFLRSDYRGWVGFLSTSQFISIFILAGGILLWILSGKGLFNKKNQENAGA